MLHSAILPVHTQRSDPGVAETEPSTVAEASTERIPDTGPSTLDGSTAPPTPLLNDGSTAPPTPLLKGEHTPSDDDTVGPAVCDSSAAGSSPWEALSLLSPPPSHKIEGRRRSPCLSGKGDGMCDTLPTSSEDSKNEAARSSPQPFYQRLEEARSLQGRAERERFIEVQARRLSALEAENAELRGALLRLQAQSHGPQSEEMQKPSHNSEGALVIPDGMHSSETTSLSTSSSRSMSVAMGMSPTYEKLCRTALSPE